MENYGSKTRYALQSHKVESDEFVTDNQTEVYANSPCPPLRRPPRRRRGRNLYTRSRSRRGYREVCRPQVWFIQRPFSEFLRSEPDKRITIIGRGTTAIDLTRFSTPRLSSQTELADGAKRRYREEEFKVELPISFWLRSAAATKSHFLFPRLSTRITLIASLRWGCSWIATLVDQHAFDDPATIDFEEQKVAG